MSRLILAAAAAAVLAIPSPASAAWTAPATITTGDEANPVAQGALGGSVLLGWLERTVSVARRDGDGFGAPARLNAADPFETVWGAALAQDGSAVVVTVRRHKPLQRVRATLVAPDGSRSGPVTISDRSHSAAGPHLSVAADGTAVAAWLWHDPAGWRVQAAIRRPGEARFGRPQTLSEPAIAGRRRPRPWIDVAAGPGGRAVLSWQIGGDFALPEAPLHVHTAGPDGVFGADQPFVDAGGLADVGLAVGPSGEVQVAYLDQHFSGHEAPSRLRVAQGTAGTPLSAPVALSTGGRGTSSGSQVGAAFSADGSATVAWAKPGDRYEEGGTLEVFTRPAAGAFGAAQTLATHAEGIALAGGPGASAALAWMVSPARGRHGVHAATRPGAGGAFGADEPLSAPGRHALWPSLAITPAGDAVVAWVTNDSGGGSGEPTAAVQHIPAPPTG